jgi:hypothetical protein
MRITCSSLGYLRNAQRELREFKGNYLKLDRLTAIIVGTLGLAVTKCRNFSGADAVGRGI